MRLAESSCGNFVPAERTGWNFVTAQAGMSGRCVSCFGCEKHDLLLDPQIERGQDLGDPSHRDQNLLFRWVD